jgi:very-short-patch-repair endonuclease
MCSIAESFAGLATRNLGEGPFARVAEIAARQNGVITTAQLRACGFENGSIESAVRHKRLQRVHRGVYAVGHRAPSRLADWHGAVLACGPDAWLSVAHAATALEFHDRPGRLIDVTVSGRSGRRRPGIAIHHMELLPLEVGTWRNIPITSPSRTMVDLAHELRTEERITWALRQLEFRHHFDPRLLELSNHRRPNRILRRLLLGIEPTLSPLEIAFLHRVVRRHNLPTPDVNVRPVSFLVDFLWPGAMLIVETDGRQHDGPLQRQADALRDALHAEAGYLTLRYRWADVQSHDARTAREIRRQLRLRTGARL